MKHKLSVSIVVLISIVLITGCLTPDPTKPALESSVLDAQILSVVDVTDDYPEMQKASVGWYKTPTLDGKFVFDLSHPDTTNVYYLVWNKPTHISLDTKDVNAGFILSPESYNINFNDEKRIHEVKVSVDTSNTGQFELSGLNVPPLTIKIP